jgi:hypothetical protein
MSNHVHNWEHVPTASSDKCSRYKCACGKWARKQWTAKGLRPANRAHEPGATARMVRGLGRRTEAQGRVLAQRSVGTC